MAFLNSTIYYLNFVSAKSKEKPTRAYSAKVTYSAERHLDWLSCSENCCWLNRYAAISCCSNKYCLLFDSQFTFECQCCHVSIGSSASAQSLLAKHPTSGLLRLPFSAWLRDPPRASKPIIDWSHSLYLNLKRYPETSGYSESRIAQFLNEPAGFLHFCPNWYLIWGLVRSSR